MEQQSAETIALKALAWLVGNDELLPVFLGSTGSDIGALKQAASDPALLAGVLDFLTMDDTWIMAFCEENGLEYQAPLAARSRLSSEVHWT